MQFIAVLSQPQSVNRIRLNHRAVTLYSPGRPIKGRGWPRTVQLDVKTVGTLFYDLDAKQTGGPAVFFVRTAIERLNAD